MSEKKFNKAAYFKKKAERRKNTEAEATTCPETEATFYVRRVPPMVFALYGELASDLTGQAIENWRQDGVEVQETSKPTPEAEKRARRLMIKVVMDQCESPKIVRDDPQGDNEIALTDLEDAELIHIFKFATWQLGVDVALKGGETASTDDIARFHKSRRRGSRSRANVSELQSKAV